MRSNIIRASMFQQLLSHQHHLVTVLMQVPSADLTFLNPDIQTTLYMYMYVNYIQYMYVYTSDFNKFY